MARDMPIGDCCVCDEALDLSEAGICKSCGHGFHWNECGRWHGNEHCCDNCLPDDEADYE